MQTKLHEIKAKLYDPQLFSYLSYVIMHQYTMSSTKISYLLDSFKMNTLTCLNQVVVAS